MNRILNGAITLLSLVGAGIALTLTFRHFKPDINLGCGIGTEGCGGVLASPYSKVGPLPLALFGLLMYLAIIYLNRSKSMATSPEGEETTPPKGLELLLMPHSLVWLFSASGTLFSWWLQYVALFKIEKLCPWCFGSAVTITLIFLCASLRLIKTYPHILDGDRKLVTGVLSALAVLGLVYNAPVIHIQYSKIITAAEVSKHRRIGQGNEKPFDIETLWATKLEKEILQDYMKPTGRSDSHVKGDPKAPIMIVEFADYTCPTCKSVNPIIDQMLDRFKGKIRYAFRNRPIPHPDHKWNREAALAVEAAGLQGKFWEMHDIMYDRQEVMMDDKFNDSGFEGIAKDIGIDVAAFNQARNSPAIKKILDDDIALADAIEVVTTPSFIAIRGKQAWRFDRFMELGDALNDSNHPLWKEPQAPAKATKPSNP
jgi:protein-disulfide isomerase/uncharacterized membrane protein